MGAVFIFSKALFNIHLQGYYKHPRTRTVIPPLFPIYFNVYSLLFTYYSTFYLLDSQNQSGKAKQQNTSSSTISVNPATLCTKKESETSIEVTKANEVGNEGTKAKDVGNEVSKAKEVGNEATQQRVSQVSPSSFVLDKESLSSADIENIKKMLSRLARQRDTENVNNNTDSSSKQHEAADINEKGESVHESQDQESTGYECKQCQKHFVSSSELYKHNKINHTVEVSNKKCLDCNKLFSTEWNLRRHQENVHGRYITDLI